MELDSVLPNLDNITSLCKVFKVTADYIIKGIANTPKEKKNHLPSAILSILSGIMVIVLSIILITKQDGNEVSFRFEITYREFAILIELIFISLGVVFLLKKNT